MTPLKALIWDVDGTLAETERDGHRVAFNLAFEACGVPWHWDEAHYGHLLNVSGGLERLLYDMASRADAPVLPNERQALAQVVHARKTEIYVELVNDGVIPLRPGVAELMAQCRERGVRMAIATTTHRTNVEALLRVHLGPRWAQQFDALVCGEDVTLKKPDPEVYQKVLSSLDLEPLHTVAIEDSPGGVAAACAADVPVIVTQSAYFANATIDGAIAIGPGLHERRGWRPALRVSSSAGEPPEPVTLDDVEGWCAEMDTVSQFA